MFCPECGKPLANLSESVEAPSAAPSSNPAVGQTSSSEPNEVPKVQSSETPVKEESVHGDAVTRQGKPDKPAESRPSQGAREKTREKLQRASSVARGALEDNVKRVEKIHHVSTVMLEEASYDPSLRFVLVALGLFIVFVILLVLSKVMG